MSEPTLSRPVATLWRLALNHESLRCVIYRDARGMQLRVESATAVIVTEPFDLQPRALARSRVLRESLKRRGWTETSTE